MYQTKKQLRLDIQKLKFELYSLKRQELVSAYIKQAGLPKCESEMCAACVHAAKRVNNLGYEVVLGCQKDLECKEFTPETKIVLLSNAERLYR